MKPLDFLVILQQSHVECCGRVGMPSVLKVSPKANDLICRALDQIVGQDRGFRFISSWNTIPVRMEMGQKDISFVFFV